MNRWVTHAKANLVGSRVFVIGALGKKASQDFTSLLYLNHLSGRWTWRDLPGPYLRGHCSVLSGDRLFAWGGRGQFDVLEQKSFVWVLDLVLLEWRALQTYGIEPEPRGLGTGEVLAVRDELIYFGGSLVSDGSLTNEVLILDLKDLSWTKPEIQGNSPPARCKHASCLVGEQMFIHGGIRMNPDMIYSDVHILHRKRGKVVWSQPRVGPSKVTALSRAAHSINLFNGMLFLYGGYDIEGFELGTVLTFDFKKQVWNEVLIKGRTGDVEGSRPSFAHTAVSTPTKLIVFGGIGCHARDCAAIISEEIAR